MKKYVQANRLLTGQDSADEISLQSFQEPCQHSRSCLGSTWVRGSPAPLAEPQCPPAAYLDDSTIKHTFQPCTLANLRTGKQTRTPVSAPTNLTWDVLPSVRVTIVKWSHRRSSHLRLTNYYKLARTGLTVDPYLLPTSKSRDTKTKTKIKNPAPISFRYCAVI